MEIRGDTVYYAGDMEPRNKMFLKRNGRMKKYAEVLTENDSEATRGAIEKILDDSTRFMTETVNVPAKYMSGYVGEKWSIKGFILWCKKTGQIEFRKAGWRSVKK